MTERNRRKRKNRGTKWKLIKTEVKREKKSKKNEGVRLKCIQLLNLILGASRGLIWIQAFSWQVKRLKAEKDENEKSALLKSGRTICLPICQNWMNEPETLTSNSLQRLYVCSTVTLQMCWKSGLNARQFMSVVDCAEIIRRKKPDLLHIDLKTNNKKRRYMAQTIERPMLNCLLVNHKSAKHLSFPEILAKAKNHFVISI